MKKFTDKNGLEVVFSNEKCFGAAKHVFVLARFHDKWVLTKHRKRGLEFPGGKKEGEETIEEALIREVYEETGGVVEEYVFVGQYQVFDPEKPFVKDIFFAWLSELQTKENYLETDGPILVKQLEVDQQYSFIMKDEMLRLSLEECRQKGLPYK